ncbi:hypothetical protein AB7942_23695 [Neobacillus sp. BF23-41]|uniref:hypothetical protein n=1 Tax=Neobacillus sp. BF23-41 TaxID=3240280 RepID=UPI0034E56ABB
MYKYGKLSQRSWRTLEETVQPLSIVEEITLIAVKEIKDKGLLVSAKELLKSGNIKLDDDDDDWP